MRSALPQPSNSHGCLTSCQTLSSGSGLIPGILLTSLIGAAKKTTLYAGPDGRDGVGLVRDFNGHGIKTPSPFCDIV